MSPAEWLASQSTAAPAAVPPVAAPARASLASTRRETDRAEILNAEMRKARERVMAGDTRAAGDVEALTREMQRLNIPIAGATAPIASMAVPAVATPTPVVAAATAALSPADWLASQTPAATAAVPPVDVQPATPEVPSTTMGGLVGAVTRGLAPVAVGAGLGAIAGAPLAGVGAIPGAVVGAGAAAIASVLGDPVVGAINGLLGTQFTMPTEAMEQLLTRIGVAQPKTEAERIVQSASAGAGVGGGLVAAGQAITRAAGAVSPVAARVGGVLAGQPAAQIAGSATGGAAGQAAQEAGAGPVGQVLAGVAGGMVGAAAGAIRTTNIQLPSDLTAAREAGIRVLTSDAILPRTFAQKWLQTIGERIPVVGTGSVRQQQQAERIQAVKNVADDFGVDDPQLLSTKVMNDLATKRGAELSEYVGARAAVVQKISTAQAQVGPGQSLIDEANVLAAKATDLLGDQAALSVRVADLRAEASPRLSRIASLDARITQRQVKIDEANTAAALKRQQGQSMIDGVSNASVTVTRTMAAIDTEIATLTAMGTNQVNPAISILRDWKASIQGKDLANVELLRKQLSQSFKAPELTAIRGIGDKAVSNIYRPLADDMGDFIQANGTGRDFTKWQVANKRLTEMSGELKMDSLKSVLSRGELVPETVNRLLFSSKPSEITQLYKGLTPQGRAHARSAIITRAVNNSNGIDNISPEKFATQVDKLSKSINVFFTGDELNRVQGLARVIRLTKRGAEASLLPATGVQNFYAMLGVSVGGATSGVSGAVIAGTAMGTVGGAARIYESAAVRNLLLRLPRTPAGSAEELALTKRLFTAIDSQQRVATPEIAEE